MLSAPFRLWRCRYQIQTYDVALMSQRECVCVCTRKKNPFQKSVTLKGRSSLCKKKRARPNGTNTVTRNESKFQEIRMRPGALVTSRQALSRARCHIWHNQFTTELSSVGIKLRIFSIACLFYFESQAFLADNISLDIDAKSRVINSFIR